MKVLGVTIISCIITLGVGLPLLSWGSPNSFLGTDEIQLFPGVTIGDDYTDKMDDITQDGTSVAHRLIFYPSQDSYVDQETPFTNTHVYAAYFFLRVRSLAEKNQRALVQFYTGYLPNLYYDIQPGVPHTYRLEVYGGDYFEFQIDGVVMDSGEPEAVWPTPDALLSWGTSYYRAESTSEWDYVRFGTIPEPATGLLVLFGAGVLLRRRFARG